MRKFWWAALAAVWLSGCATAPESQAQRADDAACTAQGDATFRALDVDEMARTSQANLPYSGMPNHVFDAEHLGAMHARDSQIARCEDQGNAEAPQSQNFSPVVPHIVTNP
jgi:hypothetical protein